MILINTIGWGLSWEHINQSMGIIYYWFIYGLSWESHRWSMNGFSQKKILSSWEDPDYGSKNLMQTCLLVICDIAIEAMVHLNS